MADEFINECEFCGESFPNLVARRSYHKKAAKDCEKMYIWQSQLLQRMSRLSHPNGKKIRTEQDRPLERYSCASCGKTFLSESKLNFHKETSHGEFGCPNLKCKQCFLDEETLAKHIAKSHKTFPCPECSTICMSKELLKIHMETHQKKFEICSKCGTRLSSKANLKRHMKNLHGKIGIEMKKKGEQVNFATAAKAKGTKLDLKAHTELHDTKRIICLYCNITFTRKHDLKRHMMRIHAVGKEPNKKEPDNENNVDKVKETDDTDASKHVSNTNHSTEKALDITKELEECPLLETDDIENIFEEFGLTSSEIIGRVFREEENYFANIQNVWQRYEITSDLLMV